MDSNPAIKIPDKIKKLKDGIKVHKYKELGEEKGKMSEMTAIEKDGEVIATYETKDGKAGFTSATADAQTSGEYEKNASKGGVKKDDLNYTVPTLRGAQAAVNTQKDLDNDHSSEKAKMLGKAEPAAPATKPKTQERVLDYSKMKAPQDQSWHWKKKWDAKPEAEKNAFKAKLSFERKFKNTGMTKSEEMEPDNDSHMAYSQLQEIYHHLMEIKSKFNPDKDLPDWMDAKITEAADKLATVAHYLDSHKQPESKPEEIHKYGHAVLKCDTLKKMSAMCKAKLQKDIDGKSWGEMMVEGKMPQVNPKLINDQPTHTYKGVKVKHLKATGNGTHTVEIMEGPDKGKWSTAHEKDMKPVNNHRDTHEMSTTDRIAKIKDKYKYMFKSAKKLAKFDQGSSIATSGISAPTIDQDKAKAFTDSFKNSLGGGQAFQAIGQAMSGAANTVGNMVSNAAGALGFGKSREALEKGVMSPGSTKDTFPKTFGALKIDGDLHNHDVMAHHMKLHEKHAMQAANAGDKESAKHHWGEVKKIHSHLYSQSAKEIQKSADKPMSMADKMGNMCKAVKKQGLEKAMTPPSAPPTAMPTVKVPKDPLKDKTPKIQILKPKTTTVVSTTKGI